jgi:hydroxymethylglutaryl-CoA reductase
MKEESFKGFYKKTIKERQSILAEEFDLTGEEKKLLEKEGALPFEVADRMVENVVGTFPLPYGLATNFVIDGKKYVIPFAIEEPSVIAAASNAAKLSSGFETSCDEPIMIGQIQVLDLEDVEHAKNTIEHHKTELLEFATTVDPILVKFGGGPKDLQVNIIEDEKGKMLDIHLLVDVRDAMGANAINTMTEKLAPKIEELTKGKVLLRIISNLAIYRRAQAKTTWTKEVLEASTKGQFKGEEVVDAILNAYRFANATQFRATTHNKGAMNGIDAVVIATGNDFRAIESGAHSFAAYNGKYSPLTKYSKDKDGNLVGEIDIPLALGLVGGATKVHPMAQLSIKILGVKTANDLARIIASVGLAQNFGALRALATVGIQEGHMKLHAKNIAVQAGATKEEIDAVAAKLAEEKNVSQARAEEILKEIRK